MKARLALALVAAMLVAVAPAQAAQVSESPRFTASDGVSLQATISGEGSLAARPVLVEFSPYGRGQGTPRPRPRLQHAPRPDPRHREQRRPLRRARPAHAGGRRGGAPLGLRSTLERRPA